MGNFYEDNKDIAATIDALDLTEAMEGVSYSLAEVRREAVEIRHQAVELTGMPVVFGE